jgi:hypothetical protein
LELGFELSVLALVSVLVSLEVDSDLVVSLTSDPDDRPADERESVL